MTGEKGVEFIGESGIAQHATIERCGGDEAKRLACKVSLVATGSYRNASAKGTYVHARRLGRGL